MAHAGFSFGKNRPSGKLYLGTNQVDLVSEAWTKVLLDTISSGFADAIEDTVNHRITPGVAGYYRIKGQVCFLNTVADKDYQAELKLDGSINQAIDIDHASLGKTIMVACSTLVYLSASSYVELWAMQASGVNTVDLSGLEHLTFLTVQRAR